LQTYSTSLARDNQRFMQVREKKGTQFLNAIGLADKMRRQFWDVHQPPRWWRVFCELPDEIRQVEVELRVRLKILSVEELQILRHQIVAAQPDDRVNALHGLEVGEAPFLRNVIGGNSLGSDHQDQAIAIIYSIADFLIERKLPRGHGKAIKPNSKSGRSQSGGKTPHKRFVVATSVREENFAAH
jgi:hypothetical protein